MKVSLLTEERQELFVPQIPTPCRMKSGQITCLCAGIRAEL